VRLLLRPALAFFQPRGCAPQQADGLRPVQLPPTHETPPGILSSIKNIEKSDLLLTSAHSTIQEEWQTQTCVSAGQGEGWKSSESIVNRLFGDKLYRYKLKLRNKFPNTIYKERNIGLNVELLD
jgi:hypothetical protein